MPRKISKSEWKTLKNLVLISIPSVMIAIGLREVILERFGISSNEGMVVLGLIWLLGVYYFLK